MCLFLIMERKRKTLSFGKTNDILWAIEKGGKKWNSKGFSNKWLIFLNQRSLKMEDDDKQSVHYV
jgi:hypothetical protein